MSVACELAQARTSPSIKSSATAASSTCGAYAGDRGRPACCAFEPSSAASASSTRGRSLTKAAGAALPIPAMAVRIDDISVIQPARLLGTGRSPKICCRKEALRDFSHLLGSTAVSTRLRAVSASSLAVWIRSSLGTGGGREASPPGLVVSVRTRSIWASMIASQVTVRSSSTHWSAAGSLFARASASSISTFCPRGLDTSMGSISLAASAPTSWASNLRTRGASSPRPSRPPCLCRRLTSPCWFPPFSPRIAGARGSAGQKDLGLGCRPIPQVAINSATTRAVHIVPTRLGNAYGLISREESSPSGEGERVDRDAERFDRATEELSRSSRGNRFGAGNGLIWRLPDPPSGLERLDGGAFRLDACWARV